MNQRGITPEMTMTEDLLARRQRVLGSGYRLFYNEPLHVARGEGVWLFDHQGKRYLDVYNNVASVGHCHPAVVEAMARQSAQLNTHTRYLHHAIVDFAEDLLSEFPAELNNVMLTCTGSEANDLALRIARHATGGTGMLVTRWAYHGVTSALAELSPSLGEGVARGNHVKLIDAPDTYRQPGAFLTSIREALAQMQQEGIRPAALLVDTIFSSDGVFSVPEGEMAQAAALIRQAGGLFIADEVQPGFGRTGESLWGFARHGIVPDLVSLGKPMGNGHPIAGLVGRSALFDAFGRDVRYFNTFGGNPVSCQAAHAVLRVIREEQLQQNALRVGDYLRQGLQQLAQDFPLIGDIRAYGLFIGVELVSDRESKAPASESASQVVNAMRQRGVLISATGPAANVLKIRPPLVFQEEHADVFLTTLSDVLKVIDTRTWE
ncbi:aminotransferase class III-fold pyridoxal phosphate-dependent enzyme [Pectobacterium versatile]|uniref:aspartate aminotransferase family protein n=1 Tax=Pectobacterium versatile TaxID=2488639 RepID=UPI001CE21FC4|nr:aminotransferase class III-fold pyridoxal phosphate-dependent enzyme [Pectobacterium versatile]MCA5932439.1 aminotransferase class III-fold pyridoxal phosphate-dependent enzyme [Pectobacterium versatile]MCA5949645.1 aminotransferase class III-fold pyridoxal phosphate-dependent enzyme [Pectobacterium versatile]MCA5954061.1 aminotransferase class III-fold pyridoxal phosphate-dependent enzyme [Pectobacterium versatile]UCP86126.1 aminotransferase class III-fold pyridoxal phosphate-dependent enzy